jgi:transposase
MLITSVVVENRRVRDVAAQYGVSESWLFELLARYRAEGDAASEPRSRRPQLLRELVLDPAKRYQPIPRTDTSH